MTEEIKGEDEVRVPPTEEARDGGLEGISIHIEGATVPLAEVRNLGVLIELAETRRRFGPGPVRDEDIMRKALKKLKRS